VAVAVAVAEMDKEVPTLLRATIQRTRPSVTG